MKKRGILYIATGAGYTKMAIASAKSVKQIHPDLAIHLFTDQENIQSAFIDSYGLIKNPNRRSKIQYLNHTPFQETLFLDADTQVLQSLGDIFDWLKKYDLAMVHAMRRNTFATNQHWRENIPNAFPQLNSGVILFRATEPVKKLFEQWKNAYEQTAFRLDQVTLRELCWQSNLSLGILPPYYNIRDTKYLPFWKSLGKPVVILHLDSYKDNFGIIQKTKKKQRSFLGRVKYLWGAALWILRQPIPWRFQLFRDE